MLNTADRASRALLLITLMFAFGTTPSWAAPSFFEKFTSDFKKAVTGQQTPPPQPAAASAPKPLPQGRLTSASNLRAGPGTSAAKLATLPKDAWVTIVSEQGKWYQVQTSVDGRPTSGWIYAPLVTVESGGGTTAARPRTAAAAVPPAGAVAGLPPGAGGSTITYAGYSKEFLPVKQMMERGDLAGVAKLFAQQDAEIRKQAKNEQDLIEQIGFLKWLERGTLAIDEGDFTQSERDFAYAERLLDERQQESKVSGWFKSATKFTAETVLGNEELHDYPGEGYERVLMLNYKSIAHLLKGERKAYNVTRRAIDWQNIEKKAFEKKLRDVEEELAKKQAKAGDKQQSNDIGNRVSQDYAALDAKASTVPSAYVNPFGYYVAGMIQEYESYDDWSLRDNARISYSKALELNPGSAVLKKAAKDMEQRTAPSGTRLVHVVVADGFVPEKKMLAYNLSFGGAVVPVKLPIYEPVPSSVHRIEVQTSGGKRLAVLSPVADVEAICLRHQKDMEPFRQLRVTLAAASSVVTRSALNSLGVIGNAISNTRDAMAAPDMRSWMSLPSTIQAARLKLRKGINKLKVVSFDQRGRKLASKSLEINRDSHDFVYLRSINGTLYGYASKDLWMLAGK